MAASYRSGAVFLGKLDMPILDFRHYLERELDMHHSRQSFVTRLRMQRHQGHSENQLIWFSDLPYEPFSDALNLMERWLDNMREDDSLSVVDAKPSDATDRCYAGDGTLIAEGPGIWDGEWNNKPAGACTRVYPPFSNPRMIAGDDYASDILKCHLRSIDKAIADGVYAHVDMRPYRDELQRIFPIGVCDYSLGDAARPDDLP